MAKSDYLHMRVDPELKQALIAEAKRRFIDTSALVSLILASWLESNARKRIDPLARSSSTDPAVDASEVRPESDNDSASV
jgi:hypothetical protein